MMVHRKYKMIARAITPTPVISTQMIAAALLASLLALLLLATPGFAQQGENDMTGDTGDASATIQDAGAFEAENEIAEQTVFAPATDWQNAGAPSDGWIPLTPGTNQWYKFKYTWNLDDEKAFDAVVELRMSPVNCAAFDVQTQGRLDFPFDDDGEFVGPIGRGTPFTKHVSGQDEPVRDNARLIWVGSARASEVYYVIVKPRTEDACHYQISISGPTVSF